MPSLIRDAQGQLTEADPNAQDTQQLAKLQGIPVTPTSPAGVAATGGTPDQSKMAGTPAQKGPVLQQQGNPQATLQTAERTQQQASENDEQARQKAEQLSSLGSLSTRVQALINKDLTLKSPAVGQVDQTNLQAATGGLSADKQAQAQALIQKIAANPNDPKAVAEAAQFWQESLGQGVDTFSPDKFLASAQTALAAQAQQQVTQATGGAVTLKDVGLTDAEAQNLTQTFGDGWQSLTVPQLQQKIEDMRQSEYNRVAGIKAELMTATGAQRQALTAELAAAGHGGATGAEQQIQHISQAVKQGDTVTIGGEEHKVEDLLKDGQISDLVTKMMNDPAMAAKVAQSNPEFAAWVKNNATALGQLSQQAAATMGTVRGAEQQKQQLAKVGNTTLNADVMKSLVPDWDKVTGGVPDTSKSSILQALKNPQLAPASAQAMATSLNDLHQTDPDAFTKLQGMDAAGVQHAWEYAQDVAAQNDPTGLLAGLSGAKGSFVTDQAAQAAIAKYKPVTDALAAVYDQQGMHAIVSGDHKDLFKQLVAGGQLKAKDVQALAANPDAWKNYVAYHDTVDKFQKAYKAGDMGAVLDTVFGHTTDVSQVNDAYTAARKAAAMGDADAAKKVAAYKRLDSNGDGVIDSKDLKAIGDQQIKSMQPTGTGGSGLENFLSGGPKNDLQSAVKDLDTNTTSGPSKAFMDQFEGIMGDGHDKMTQMAELDKAGLLGKAQQMNGDMLSKYGIDIQGYKQSQQNAKAAEGTQAVNSVMGTRMGDIGDIAAFINSGKVWDDSKGRLPDVKKKLEEQQQKLLTEGNTAGAQAFDQQLTQISQLIAKNQANQQAAASKQAADTAAAEAAAAIEQRKNTAAHGNTAQRAHNG